MSAKLVSRAQAGATADRNPFMTSTTRTFGLHGPAQMFVEDVDPERTISVQREMWFDQDIDGRWLICVMRTDGELSRTLIGSLIVTDSRVSDFIETMAQLISDPEQFSGEPQFHSPF